MKRLRLIVTGYMARCPIGGVIWQHVHYILGLQRLGHDVFYIEDSTAHPYHPLVGDYVADWSYTAEAMPRLARRFGFEERWGFRARYLEDRPTAGLSSARINQLYREADAIINVCGEQELHEDVLQCRRLIYIESDPGKEQCLIDENTRAPIRSILEKYHSVFTFGENIGTQKFPVPLHGIRWLPTRQPVVTDHWKCDAPPPAGAVYSTVANWNTKGKDIEWRGDKYIWSKAKEFLRFIDAPRAIGEPVEMRTNIQDLTTVEQLTSKGWRIADAAPISIDADRYVEYVRTSKGEFTVAKDQYVRLNTGWFSDRTACYLAAGRPVITQETGFTRLYGGSEGLFAFRSLEEVAEAGKAIRKDYGRQSRAAFEVAAEYFEATKVLASLLDRAA